MPKDRDQLTPAEPEDAEHLATSRGQGTAGTGRDLLPEEAADDEAAKLAGAPTSRRAAPTGRDRSGRPCRTLDRTLVPEARLLEATTPAS